MTTYTKVVCSLMAIAQLTLFVPAKSFAQGPEREVGGALLGAIPGLFIGGAIAGKNNRGTGMLIGALSGAVIGGTIAHITRGEREEMRRRGRTCYGGRPGATCDWHGERHRFRTQIDESRPYYHPRYERQLNCNKTVTHIHDRYTGQLVETRIKRVCEVENEWLEMEDDELQDGPPPPPRIPGASRVRDLGPRPIPHQYLGSYLNGLAARQSDLEKLDLVTQNMVPYLEKHNLALNAGQLRDVLSHFRTDRDRNSALRQLSKQTSFNSTEIRFITDVFRSDRGAFQAEGELTRRIRYGQ